MGIWIYHRPRNVNCNHTEHLLPTHETGGRLDHSKAYHPAFSFFGSVTNRRMFVFFRHDCPRGQGRGRSRCWSVRWKGWNWWSFIQWWLKVGWRQFEFWWVEFNRWELSERGDLNLGALDWWRYYNWRLVYNRRLIEFGWSNHHSRHFVNGRNGSIGRQFVNWWRCTHGRQGGNWRHSCDRRLIPNRWCDSHWRHTGNGWNTLDGWCNSHWRHTRNRRDHCRETYRIECFRWVRPLVCSAHGRASSLLGLQRLR